MKISIYLASFVLLKAMMPGTLYAPITRGDDSCADSVKTTIAAPAPAAPNIVTKEDIEALKQQNKEMQGQITQLVTLVQSMQDGKATSGAQVASNAPPAPPLPNNGVSSQPQANLALLEFLQNAFAGFKDNMSAADKLKTIKESKKKNRAESAPNKKQLGAAGTSSVQSLSDSNNEAKGLMEELAGKLQGAADVLPAASNPIENKPELPPKPRVSADKPSAPVVTTTENSAVVAEEEKPLSEEFREVNGSAESETAPVVQEPVEKTASESAEKSKRFAERRAAFEQKTPAVSKEVPVAETPAKNSLTRVGTIRKKFEKLQSSS